MSVIKYKNPWYRFNSYTLLSHIFSSFPSSKSWISPCPQPPQMKICNDYTDGVSHPQLILVLTLWHLLMMPLDHPADCKVDGVERKQTFGIRTLKETLGGFHLDEKEMRKQSKISHKYRWKVFQLLKSPLRSTDPDPECYQKMMLHCRVLRPALQGVKAWMKGPPLISSIMYINWI